MVWSGLKGLDEVDMDRERWTNRICLYKHDLGIVVVRVVAMV